MSTKKDANKTSNTNLSSKKKVATRTSTKREESTDRKNVKKTEDPNKIRSKVNSLEKKDDSGAKRTTNLKTGKNIKAQSTTPRENTILSSTKTIKPKVPVTPPSNRVSKTQYFPSKNLYSNALRDEVVPSRSASSTEKIKEKVVPKPNDIKTISKRDTSKKPVEKVSLQKSTIKPFIAAERNKLKNSNANTSKTRDISPDSSSISERPRTATLRKPSIVNANIVGPDAPKQIVPKSKLQKLKPPSPKSEASDECNYEDDFDSYESDFEEYFSSSSSNLENISGGEETSSTSSSSQSINLGLPQGSLISKRKSSAETDDERKMDSGNFDMSEFKHKQVLDNIKESIEKENSNIKIHEVQRNNPASLPDEGFEDQKSMQFINFLDAKKKYKHRRSMELKRKRGEEILNMIRLDTYSFTLFDLPAVPYEVFIKNYGRSNTVQAGVQTGEDNVDEDIQTDEITNSCKWTQFPVRFSKIDTDNPNYWQVYKSDYLGVGGDGNAETKVDNATFNENSLKKFLLSAGNLILRLQAESNIENCDKIKTNSRNIPFSDGYISFNTNMSIVKDCSVRCFAFGSDNDILTVHSTKQEKEYKCVICVWTLSNPEEPVTFFISYGEVSCCSFGMDCSDFVYTGSDDGVLSIWDIKKKVFNEDSEIKRIPLHTTGIDSGHVGKIVSLQPFSSYADRTFQFQSNQTNEASTFVICSLDEDGTIIIWSVITKYSSDESNTSNCTSWNDVVLVKNTVICLKSVYSELEDLLCTDFIVNATDSNYALVSTNYGFIIHHLIKGGRSNVKKFIPESPSMANCIEVCPFSPNYFLTGFSDGNINLYSRLVEKPIMVLSDKEQNCKINGIETIQWSRSKPFVIYTKDVNNTIHIWDLNESDIYPVCSIPFSENITYLQLSPLLSQQNHKKAYMMIGTDNGCLYLHVLNSDHGPQPSQTYNEHVNTFLKYVNRL
ncbi:hypothetical protein NQ315_008406 [Exocentrus adspersus]|uniref:WD repeat-containing protein 60 n=1 Tax=Exocentrus adspersus TaxID=1586481 RepID=A0AAV8W613_9CUCU|nr:hypothetical protein NQ315_008406 [Exocentrus adspersus]